VVPEFSWNGSYLAMLIGVVGTTIAPWMQFYLQAAVVEKGVKLSDYRLSYYDVVVGCVVTDVVALFIIVACAATLYTHHISIESAQDAALALAPLAGKYCAGLFAFGLFNASLFAASILPLATAHYVCEGFGWEAGIDNKFRDAPQFFTLYSALIALGSVVILIPDFPLLAVMYLSQVLNGMLLPFVLIFVLLLINRTDLMGKYVNSRTYNVIAWSSSAVMIILTVAMVVSLIFFGA
jgi:Mn2+/Fe2+ NRAMP family transporter